MKPARRGACPSLAAPMPTGDGLLVRLSPLDRRLSAPALKGLARAAARLGNGVVEITSRGSLQLRGFTETSAAALADVVAGLDLAVTTGVTVDTGPFAGLDPAEITDPRPLAASLRRALAASGRRFAPKASVVVDGGGRLPLDQLACDVRLKAARGGGWTCDGAVVADPVGYVMDRLASPGRRLADTVRPAAEVIGTHGLRGGLFALGIGLPFGQVPAAALEALASPSAAEFRLAPGRALLVVGVAAADLPLWEQKAKAAGFVVEPGDPRRSVAACPGCPACAAGEIPAREMAGEIAGSTAALLDGSLTLHVSGCAKGCAHPGPALLSLTGVDGACELAMGGAPLARMRPRAAVRALADLARLVAERRSGGETAAACLERLGGDRVGAQLRDRLHA